MADHVNLLIGSGGRRNYLVNWFRQALSDLGISGRVCVIDSTPSAPALADADSSAVVPPFSSPEYFPAIEALCVEWRVDLAFSLNDFEATLWATAEKSPFERAGVNLIAPTSACQSLVEDKAAYPAAFSAVGVMTPPTLTGTEAISLDELPWAGDAIVKHRFGSGSVGLARVSSEDWRAQLLRTATKARDRFGIPVTDKNAGLENVVIQRAIDGVEHGVDVVHDFEGKFAGVLVRRKLRMRSGETDQAVSESPEPFNGLARSIGEVTGHRGLIDTDVLVDAVGDMYVIDVNPRFGGGYPFSHVAGASIPRAYIAWHLGLPVDPTWLDYVHGVTSAKTEDIRVAKDFTSYQDRRSL